MLQFLDVASGIAITVLIVLANFFQFRIMRRFSGVIGRVMFWYSLGLAAMLAQTIFNILVDILGWRLPLVLLGNQLLFMVAIALFFRGSIIIR